MAYDLRAAVTAGKRDGMRRQCEVALSTIADADLAVVALYFARVLEAGNPSTWDGDAGRAKGQPGAAAEYVGADTNSGVPF